MSHKLLSILIPTYNRAEVLIYTLSLFEDQILRNIEEVELIVSDNVSDDVALLEKYAKEHTFFTLRKYSEHVECCESIMRSEENGSGEFFILYGDDDVPAPYMVDTILDNIKKYPDVGKIVFNRMVGRTAEDSLDLEKIYVLGQKSFGKGIDYCTDSAQFAHDHQMEFGFISVNVVRRCLWDKFYKDVYPNDHIGFEDMLPLVYSTKDAPSLYIEYPLCIQRRPSLIKNNIGHDFKGERAMLFFLVGWPRAIRKQGELGLLKDWKATYQQYLRYENNSYHDIKRHFYEMCTAKSGFLRPYVDDLCDFQSEADMELRLMFQRLLKTTGKDYSYWKIYYKVNIYGWRKSIKGLIQTFKGK